MKFSALLTFASVLLVPCALASEVGDGGNLLLDDGSVSTPVQATPKPVLICPLPCSVKTSLRMLDQAIMGFKASARLFAKAIGKNCNCLDVNVSLTQFFYSQQPMLYALSCVDSLMAPSFKTPKKEAKDGKHLEHLPYQSISVCRLGVAGCNRECATEVMKMAYKLLLRMKAIAHEPANSPFACFQRWQQLDLVIRQFYSLMAQSMYIYLTPCVACGVVQAVEGDGEGRSGPVMDATIVLGELKKLAEKLIPGLNIEERIEE